MGSGGGQSGPHLHSTRYLTFPLLSLIVLRNYNTIALSFGADKEVRVDCWILSYSQIVFHLVFVGYIVLFYRIDEKYVCQSLSIVITKYIFIGLGLELTFTLTDNQLFTTTIHNPLVYEVTLDSG